MDKRLANRAAWVAYVSNRALVNSFCSLLADEREDSGALRRLDILGEEIRRRENAGTMTLDDWLDERKEQSGS